MLDCALTRACYYYTGGLTALKETDSDSATGGLVETGMVYKHYQRACVAHASQLKYAILMARPQAYFLSSGTFSRWKTWPLSFLTNKA